MPGNKTQFILGMVGACFIASLLHAQSITAGDITGTVKDPSGGSLQSAAVALKNVNTGAAQTATTNGDGQFRFSLLQPGTYSITVSATGFRSAEKQNVAVVAGQPTTADFQMSLASSSTTVEVTEGATEVDSENANLTTAFNSQQILNMPNPGSDLTYVAQTAPGVVMNTQSGYGNFSALGMPGTSNLFTINGQNFNDPYLGLNNSGASNLLLGSNDIAEANVINNAYSAQYGQYAGTQVGYTTKSGSNAFHGDAVYMWNGRAANANDFLDNFEGNGRPFLNFNQWQTDANGPIWKNHTFFDVDYESARVVLPTASTLVKIPSPAFQAATLAHLAADGNAAEIPFYNKLFAIENGAPAAPSGVPVAGSCGTLVVPGANGICTDEFRTTPPNTEREYLWSARVDHNFSDKDHGYIRLFRDNGYQPTYTDYFSPTFNAFSVQPQMSGQLNETHTFSPTMVNQINASAFFSSAVFAPSDQSGALSALPTVVSPTGSYFTRAGGENYLFPQGRRVFQYQVIDDLSKIAGKHTFRLGFSWLHDTVTDVSLNEYVNGRVYPASLTEFYNGGGPSSQIVQRFPTATEAPFRFNTFGGYVADDWRVSDRLTLSLNLRLENYANPTCADNCFSRLNYTFTGAPANAATPYNSSIVFNQHNAFANTQAVVWEPRIGVAWKPTSSDKTVIRAGAGVFADELPGSLALTAAQNIPGLDQFTIRGNQTASGFGAIAPGVPNSLFTVAAQANAALRSQFASGGTLSSIQAAVPGFVAPNFSSFPSTFKQPTYYKWNFEIQQAFGWKTLLSIDYAGMHGIHIPIDDNGLNAYCPTSTCPGGFAGIPRTAPDPRFGTVVQYIQAGVSSYNGLIVSLQRRMAPSLTFNANYTWSHALDVVSNGGFEPFNDQTDVSLLSPQNPYNIKANYGNADEDVRHYFSFGVVATDVFSHGLHWGPARRIFGGWTLSSNIFVRSGLPYTVVDTGTTSDIDNYGANIFASPAGNQTSASCGKAAVTDVNGNVGSPCLTTSQFAPSGTLSFGNQGRNSYRGPGFFDMDASLMKDVKIKERLTFSFGAQAFNVLNHPNFDQPVNDINNPSFGQIQSMVGTPTSILGSFVGGNNSPRFIEIRGLLRF